MNSSQIQCLIAQNVYAKQILQYKYDNIHIQILSLDEIQSSVLLGQMIHVCSRLSVFCLY